MDIWSQYVLPCLCAFAGCIGFTLVFNIHGPGKLIACCGGALGWLVYLLAGKTILAGFFAAMAISLFSEVMARIRRCPVTGYQLVALLHGAWYRPKRCPDCRKASFRLPTVLKKP